MFRTNNYIQKIQSLSKLTRSEFVNNQIRLCNQAQQVIEKKRELDFETYRFMKLSYTNSSFLKPFEKDYISKLFDKEEINDEDYCFLVLNELENDVYFSHEVQKYLQRINLKLRHLEQCETEKTFLRYHKE